MRTPRALAILTCTALSVAAVVAGIAWTPFAFLAVPVLLVAAVALRLGLSGDQVLEALDGDPGRGPAGLH